LGPVIAGLIIAGEINSIHHQETAGVGVQAISSYEQDREGLARAFFVDGLTFALSLITLLFLKVRDLEGEEKSVADTSLYIEIREAALWVWSIPAVRLGFVGMAIIHFFFMPMIFVGLPVWAKARFFEGAYVYGLVTASFGLGAFIGAVGSGFLAGPKDENLVPTMFKLYVFSGSTLALIIFYDPYWWAMLLFFITGVFEAFLYVHFTTWLQRITPEALLGRVMSILMLMSMGLLPIADAIMGFAIDWSLEATMIGSSAFLMLFCGLIAIHPLSRVVITQER
jgi:hypothetical protein